MFIIVPAIIIFLAFSYLHLNKDVSMIVQVLIYAFILVVILLSWYIYKSIQKNLKQQEVNKILLEIHQLQKKLKNVKTQSQQDTLQLQIKKLQKEVMLDQS